MRFQLHRQLHQGLIRRGSGLAGPCSLPVTLKQSLNGDERFISNFFFLVLVGSFCELCILHLLFIGVESYLGHFLEAILGELKK